MRIAVGGKALRFRDFQRTVRIGGLHENVKVRLRDRAGNWSAWRPAGIARGARNQQPGRGATRGHEKAVAGGRGCSAGRGGGGGASERSHRCGGEVSEGHRPDLTRTVAVDCASTERPAAARVVTTHVPGASVAVHR